MSFSDHFAKRPIQHLRRTTGLLAAVILLLAAIGISGCASTSPGSPNDISVTGTITVRGNVPFHETVLITDDGNWYLLDMDATMRESLVTPVRATATGTIRLGEWNGKPFTRMTVSELTAQNL